MEVLFAKRLRELRLKKRLTQTQLSAYLGYGYTAVANYESGRNEPSLRDVARLCQVFDVSADYLIGISDVEKPPEGSRA